MAASTISAIFGAGLLSIPFSFSMLGTFLSFPTLLFFGGITMLSIGFLLKSADTLKVDTYSEIIEACLGKHVNIFSNLVVMLCCYLTTLVYANIIAKNILQFLPDLTCKKMIVGIPICAVLYLSLLVKDLKSLRYAFIVTITVTISISALFIYYSIGLPAAAFYFPVVDPGKGLGILIFALSCQQNIVPISSKLQNRTFTRAILAAGLGVFFSCILYSLVGYFGVVCIGQEIGADFLQAINKPEFILKASSFDVYGILPKIATLLFAFIIFVSFAFQSFAAFAALNATLSLSKCETCLLKVFHVIFCFVFIVLDPNTGIVLNLIGAVCGAIMCYILPALSYMKLSDSRRKKIAPIGMVLFGISIAAYTIFVNVKDTILMFSAKENFSMNFFSENTTDMLIQ